MARTLQQLLIDVNSYLDLTAALPTGDDLNVRINYIQQAVREWADAYQWRDLKRTYYPTVTTLASIPLPSDFRELLSPPRVMMSDGRYESYPEIQPEDRYTNDPMQRFCYIYHSMMAGSTIVFNNLAAGASLSVDYQRYPSNMATLTDMCEVPDAEFVKLKAISYVLQSRLDERFPTIEAAAGRLLQNMIGREANVNPGGDGRIRRTGAATYRIGTRGG